MAHTKDRWVESTWLKNVDIYNKTKELPFIQEIISGKLEYNRFIFYIQQDALYIHSFTKVLETIANRIEADKYKRYFKDFVKENMAQEKELHSTYLRNSTTELILPTPTCKDFILFNNFLQENPSIEVACAGILPCFIVYQQLGIHIYSKHNRDGNPYIQWIDTYAGVEHAESVKHLREICEFYASKATPEILEQMQRSYRKGCEWDQKFWSSCYDMK